ncbi:methyltransferase [Nocardioides massiliensis]|uniref:SAM-dependent methyltransferase n=1 Tax=Nocardioides massiliensis TaxID=1325935 RepID=A0ABT9NSY0_9ACTN|nr:methyltransferase [Nocardioides massiliensis]MDP9823523.1 SAM-dependent methyltransferase [Nocardioides massiliensis]
MASAPPPPGAGDPGSATVSQRRGLARTAVVWAALETALGSVLRERRAERLRVLDVGGGTGDFAVRVAGLGADVLVVDPSPDALAALDRRARERDVADRVRGLQGDVESLSSLVEPGSVDAVLCHGVLDVLPDPAPAWEAFARVLPAGGLLSVVVGQLHAAVLARAMAGHLHQARELLETPPTSGPRRFTVDDVRASATGAGFGIDTVHAVRVFSDLVPSALLDLEPGAAEALLALESAVAERPEYLPLAQQLHVLATRV